MDDNEKALHGKTKYDLIKLVLKKNGEIEGHLRDKLQLSGENVALRNKNAPIKGYLSELDDYVKTVTRLRKEVKSLKISLDAAGKVMQQNEAQIENIECMECGKEFRSSEFYDPGEVILCDDCVTNQECPENYSQPYWKEIAMKGKLRNPDLY